MDLTIAREIIETAALTAGLEALRTQKTAAIVEQRRGDFVTAADYASERTIRSHLAVPLFEGIPFFTEETGGKPITKGWVVVVDGVDGTVNYYYGDEDWGVSVALVKDEVPIVGAICMPRRDALFSATADGPAIKRTLSTDEKRELHVTNLTELAEARVWYDYDLTRIDEPTVIRHVLALNHGTTQPVRRGCAVAGPMALVDGRCHAYHHSSVKPYDEAAAGLIVRRAGGRVTDDKGEPWKAFSGSILATNGLFHDELIELLN